MASEVKLTEAQRAMLSVFESVYPNGLAHTSDLGSIRTWRKLRELGLTWANRITASGRAAIALASPEVDEVKP